MIVTALTAYIMFSHRPAGYAPTPLTGDSNEVSKYLTHELGPQFYNGLQKRQPFEMVIIQPRLNDIITRIEYPLVSDSIHLSRPAVSFSTTGVLIICAANIKGMETFITLKARPEIDSNAMLNFNLQKIKIGAVPATSLIISALEKRFENMALTKENPSDDINSKIARSLLKNEPFDPVFTIDNKKIRISKIAFENEKLTLGFDPVP